MLCALIRAKSPTNCDVHLAESLLQTRSGNWEKRRNCNNGNDHWRCFSGKEHICKRTSS
ncbi:MAG: DUF6783 domain-containing protein [Ruminococcus sp.]|uniref:DUF6783 domain-containing protein n=1 Tax=Clostridia TaxID=186801 RepID=UPI003A37D297